MKLKTRRTLLAACIILFSLFFPIVALYSFGYRYDAEKNKIVQTGIIYITANPQDDIKIFINGKEEKKNLSIKGIFKKDYVLYNLMPQNYDIRISKDKYSEWRKNLYVSPGLITYAKPLLLPLNPSGNLISGDNDISNWSISPDFKKIAYIKIINEKTIFYIYNMEKKNTASIVLSDIMPDFANGLLYDSGLKPNFYWDNNSDNIIIEASSSISRFVGINSNSNKIIYSGQIRPDSKIIGGIWNQNNNIFIFQTDQNELYYANISSDRNKAVKISGNISGFTAKNNNIYYLDAGNSYIYSLSLDSPADKKQFSLEPLQPDDTAPQSISVPKSKIIVSNQSDIAIISPDKNLFIVKQKNGIPIKLKNNIDAADFSQNGGILFYSSPYEIFTYSLGSDTENLITRLAQKIKKTAWYKDYEHIWFINGNILKNIELDSRPIPNIIDFAAFPVPPENFIYNPNSNIIYYDQIDGNKTLIYQLTVGN